MTKRIGVEITQEIQKTESSLVCGNMKRGSKVLGKFELNIPSPSGWAGIPYYVVIWWFEVFPEHRHRGFGRDGYFALEKMIIEKYDAEEIYLEYPIPQTIDGEPWDVKGFWEKLGYAVKRERLMRKNMQIRKEPAYHFANDREMVESRREA